VRLAVGTGWLAEVLQACGADFTTRGRRADEQLQVLRTLWADNPRGASFHGEFFDFDHAVSAPKPVAHVPLHIGGHSRAAARRAGRFGDGFQPLGVTGASLSALVDEMRSTAVRYDRDPDALELSLGHSVAKIDASRAEKLAQLGADRVILAMPPVTTLDQATDAVSACAQRLGLTP
jgi:alkanesulfonate monooxygenase SsuD/methylene tetrahydromethanopterin reductase-like flavin-dependent oxidoreductase (luciferase family)